MAHKIIHPNLPESSVKDCLIGKKYTEEINELKDLGINCITLKESAVLSDEINGHADILAFNSGTGKLIINQNSIGEGVLKNIGFQVIKTNEIKAPYPYDISLNCAFISNKTICNIKYTNSLILNFAKQNNFEIINTNQGYTRCNLCIVNDHAVITEDTGLARLLKIYQFDVLTIKPGGVFLSENHHGFLGGASGKISKNKIYFSGDLSSHENYPEIMAFLNKHKVKPVFNKSRHLRDFGGFIQLTEN